MRPRPLRPTALGLAVAALAAVPSAAAPAPVASSLRPTLAALKQRTTLPIVLPSVFPVQTLEGKPLFPRIQTTARRWNVDLGLVADCNGANVCTAGYLSAVQSRRPPSSLDGRAVSLRGGLTGRYQPLSCGASCSPPSITFRRYGVNFNFQLKLRRKQGETDRGVLIRIANSALAGGRR